MKWHTVYKGVELILSGLGGESFIILSRIHPKGTQPRISSEEDISYVHTQVLITIYYLHLDLSKLILVK